MLCFLGVLRGTCFTPRSFIPVKSKSVPFGGAVHQLPPAPPPEPLSETDKRVADALARAREERERRREERSKAPRCCAVVMRGGGDGCSHSGTPAGSGPAAAGAGAP